MDWSLTTLYGDIILTCFLQHVRVAADRNMAAVAVAARRAGRSSAFSMRSSRAANSSWATG